MSSFQVLDPDLQITFYKRLQDLRKSYLLDALQNGVSSADIAQIDRELATYVLPAALKKVASWSLRGELFFPVPCLITQSPKLLGYYRLLLGFSQKQFYDPRYGYAPYKPLEVRGHLSDVNAKGLPDLCEALCRSAVKLIGGLGTLTRNSVHELTLLTLGPQLRGGALNLLGAEATRRVFKLIRSIVESSVVSESPHVLEIRNAAGRNVKVEFASDPDISIRELLGSGTYRNLVAIEIKGGKDRSNVHNRIGEAEKSHQKARKLGFVECWTIIGVASLDHDVARRESPTTDRFYSMDSIANPETEEHADFRAHLTSRVGVSD